MGESLDTILSEGLSYPVKERSIPQHSTAIHLDKPCGKEREFGCIQVVHQYNPYGKGRENTYLGSFS